MAGIASSYPPEPKAEDNGNKNKLAVIGGAFFCGLLISALAST